MDLGWQELLIVLLIAVLLFGGTKLAGLGKATGKAIREFKEETHDLSEDDKGKKKAISEETVTAPAPQPPAPQAPAPQQIPQGQGYQAPYQQQPPTAQPYQSQPYQQTPQQYSSPQQIVDGEIVDPGQNS